MSIIISEFQSWLQTRYLVLKTSVDIQTPQCSFCTRFPRSTSIIHSILPSVRFVERTNSYWYMVNIHINVRSLVPTSWNCVGKYVWGSAILTRERTLSRDAWTIVVDFISLRQILYLNFEHLMNIITNTPLTKNPQANSV
jgi:hypothetical protein